MKNYIYILGASFCLNTGLSAAVSITGAALQGFQDSEGKLLDTGGFVAILVVDTKGDGFTTDLSEGTVISTASILGEDDLIVNSVFSKASSPIFGAASILPGGGPSIELTNGVDVGDSFGVYWFSNVVTDDTLREGSTFGFIRFADVVNDTTTPNDESLGNWILPGEGGSVDAARVTNAGRAEFTVQPIPEPSSVALLGLGAFGLIARRRRA